MGVVVYSWWMYVRNQKKDQNTFGQESDAEVD
jgi:hypothetical protein